MKKIARYSTVLLIALITAALQAEAYTLKVKGMPEELLKALNDGTLSFNCWGDVGANHYYGEDLVNGISVEAGKTVTLYANGQYHFEVEKWVVDGQDKGNGQRLNEEELIRTISFTMPAHDCNVEVWMKYVPSAPDEPNAQRENYRLKVESEQMEHLSFEFFIIKNNYYESSTSSYPRGFAWTKPVNPNTDIYGNYPEVGVYPGDSVAVYIKASSNGWRFSSLEENGQQVWEGPMQYWYDSDTGNYTIKLYTFVMPKHDVTLKAYATFDPDAPGKEDNWGNGDTPGNPGANRWTASTGEVFINNVVKGRNGYVGYSMSYSQIVNELRGEYGFEWSDVKRLTIVGDLSIGAERKTGWRMYDYLRELSPSFYGNLEILDLRNTHHLSMTTTDYDATFIDESGTRVTDDMLTRIDDWNTLPSLKKLMLPACLKGFYREWGYETFIFDQLPGLQELTIYAVTPPKVDGNMLDP